MKRASGFFVLVVSCLLFSLSAQAFTASIVQDQTNAATWLGEPESPGQSFVANTSVIDSIGFEYGDWNEHRGEALITVTLRSGAGVSGPVVGSQTRNLNGLHGWADFDFSHVALVPGHTYTFYISSSSGRGAYALQHSNVYPDGMMFYGATASSNRDLKFRVLGWDSCTVVRVTDATYDIQCASGHTFTYDDITCGVEDNGNGTYTLSCGDGSSVVISDGQDGQDGSSCTVTDNGNGTSTISCEDGTSVLVSDGQDGQDGSSCTVTDNGNGTSTISCEDGTSVTIFDGQDGQDGQDGSSCSVASYADGEFTISCTDGTSATVSNGLSCTVESHDDGTATISCEDGTSAVISDGQDGHDGQDGQDGHSCTVDDNGDGTATISCTDGASYIVTDGEDGSACTVVDNGDNSATISCTDGSSFTVTSGEDGRDGGCSSTSGGPAGLLGFLLVLGAMVFFRRK